MKLTGASAPASTCNQLADPASEIVHVEGLGQHLHPRFEVTVTNGILCVTGDEQHLEAPAVGREPRRLLGGRSCRRAA